MIFALAKDMVSLFVMLSEKDLSIMRQGRTLFIDDRQLKGATFGRVIVSVSKTDNDSLELIRKSGTTVPQLAHPEPGPAESRCKGCDGLIATATMFEDKCIVCWASEAKSLRIQSN